MIDFIDKIFIIKIGGSLVKLRKIKTKHGGSKLYKTIKDARKAGLWPKAKKITKEKGDPRIEKRGWKFFYEGKNADLYFIPGKIAKMLMIRTDRTSVFDIPLDLIIEGKGEKQNQISLFGASFAKKMGINVAVSDKLPKWLPKDLKKRAQIVEMCKPLSIHGNINLELIFRNYLTGSLLKKLRDGVDPYYLGLDPALKEMYKFLVPEFTPTTKSKSDDPIPPYIVEMIYPDIVRKLRNLFVAFTREAYKKGLVIVDTKFEVFIDSKGNWILSDEILTPESSRFIKRKNFKKKKYISADKQIIRNVGTKKGWKEMAKDLPAGQVLKVDFSKKKKKQVLNGYQDILDRLAA